MANRIVTAAVTGETIKLSEKSAGAAGSFNAVSLAFTFDSAWDGTTKKVYFFDAYGANAVYIVLTSNLLVDGKYIVPIPAEPLAYAGETTITVKGIDFATDGTTAERIIMSASTTMKVLNAITPASDVVPVEPTPTQTEQLQTQIDSILADVALAAQAAGSATAAAGSALAAQTAKTNAETAETNAELAETNAKTSETNAGAYATNASNSALAASGSATAAVNAKASAETAQAAAELAETHAKTSETAASTHATNAGLSATAAATSATNADNARIAAQTAQTNAELAETNAETAEVNAETAETNAVAAKNAAELALTHAPYIDDTNGNWFIWNATTSAYVDSGTYATGAVYQAEAPTGVVLWIDSDDDAISSVTKADIGLANVDNTSDTAKPVSTAQQTALNLKVDTSAIVNDLTTGGTAVPLSAEQGKTLSTSISELQAYGKTPIATYTVSGNQEVAVTSVDVATGTFTAVGHGLVNGNAVLPIINAANIADYPIKYMPTGLTPQRYYVVNATADTFNLSITSGGSSVTYTTNALQDLTKWHIEKYISAIGLESLGNLTRCRIVIRGRCARLDTVLPYVTGAFQFYTPTFLKSGATAIGNNPDITASGSVFCALEVKVDCTSGLLLAYKGWRWHHNTASANGASEINATLYDPLIALASFSKIAVANAYLVNGTTVEVYRA